MEKKQWITLFRNNTLNEASFDVNKFNKMIDSAFSKLYNGLNELESIQNYLTQTKQGGMISTYLKKYNVKSIGDSIKKGDK